MTALAFATSIGLRGGGRTLTWDEVLELAVSAYWRKRSEILALQRVSEPGQTGERCENGGSDNKTPAPAQTGRGHGRQVGVDVAQCVSPSPDGFQPPRRGAA